VEPKGLFVRACRWAEPKETSLQPLILFTGVSAFLRDGLLQYLRSSVFTNEIIREPQNVVSFNLLLGSFIN
jgi:hypothetical protein